MPVTAEKGHLALIGEVSVSASQIHEDATVSRNGLNSWFEALESLGEFIGIRYGILEPDSTDVEWVYRSHKHYDGIGAFAEILRSDGLTVNELPQITHPSKMSWLKTLSLAFRSATPRRRVDWSEGFKEIANAQPDVSIQQPSKCVAWHLFDINETKAILRAARLIDVTVNTFLLQMLDKAIRPDIADRSSRLPWMIPVNLRSCISDLADTENRSGAVMVHTHHEQTFEILQKLVLKKLSKGEHWSVWENYKLSANLPQKIKNRLITTGRASPQWNIGCFSNLGTWNLPGQPDKKSYLFLPPVMRYQWLGAGALTYKGKLGLAIQAHPCIATNPEVAIQWMRRWVDEITVPIPADT